MNRMIALAVPALLVAALAGCNAGGGGGDPQSGSGTGGTASGHSDTACVSGKDWNLNVTDMANQMKTYLQSKGLTVTSATGTGTQQIHFLESGSMGSTTDLTFVIVTPMDHGLTMTMTQHHSGPANGDWAWNDDTNVVGFTDWVSNYAVTTTVDINGKQSTMNTPLPSTGADGADMTIVCSGDALTTQSVGSPYTMHWTSGS